MQVVNRKHRRTLDGLFTRPVSKSLRWADVASLLTGLGFDVEERAGSRVAIVKDGRVHVMHKPHPQPELKQYQIRDLREVLESHGIRPGSQE